MESGKDGNVMNKDELKGKAENLKGRAKEAFGAASGDKGKQAEGAVERAQGAIREKIGKVKEKLSHHKAEEPEEDVIDSLDEPRRSVRQAIAGRSQLTGAATATSSSRRRAP